MTTARMRSNDTARMRPLQVTVILVSRVGGVTGAGAAAAAFACAGSDPDRSGLLIDLEARRAPRPTLIASAAARGLEERLTAHLPEARAASRGWTCHLALPADRDGIRGIAAALPLADDSNAAVNLPPRLLQLALEEPLPRVGGVLLRADLGADRPLTALAARDLMERGLRVAVLKQPLGWFASRRALAGLLPAGSGGGLPERLCDRLLGERDRELVRQESAGADGDRVAQPRIQFRV
jgi:hypothetical protein